MSDLRTSLLAAAERVAAYRGSVGDHPVGPAVDVAALRAALGGDLPDAGATTAVVIDELVRAVEPALYATTGPRYFGFVIGGALDAATCADVLAVGWDQPAFNASLTPAPAAVEETVGRWLKDLLGVPASASFGLTTGAQAANTVGLTIGRHVVLDRVGWDVELDGLIGSPPIRVIAGAERHGTIDRALRAVGLGTAVVESVATDGNGAIDTMALARTLDLGPAGPMIVCLQAGNVNTGACDDLTTAITEAHHRGAWVHVDGAFGLWAAANPSTRHLVAGTDLADSWAVDGHKWLNVPYDCGYVFCAHPDAHVAGVSYTAAYLVGRDTGGLRAPSDFVAESSRRARGLATWAALRQLGRGGVADLVERCCALARRFATELGALDGVSVANDVVLNQVLVDFGGDERTDRVIAAVQRDGTCWVGGTTWQGRRLMRISVSNWTTTDDDVDRSVAAMAGALATETAR